MHQAALDTEVVAPSTASQLRGMAQPEYVIPKRLALSCRGIADREVWLGRLPALILELSRRWWLELAEPFDHHGAACSWVASATRPDGARVAFKIGMPHMEADHEILGLRFWAGNPTVCLLEADEAHNAMVLEWCEPGTPLRKLPFAQQDIVIASLLRRLWRRPPQGSGFRHLSTMTAFWCEETRRDVARWPDSGLVADGIRAFQELSVDSSDDVLLATDLHAGNVLAAEREPWLVIDPKPFIGDPTYDATQHLLNRGIRSDWS